MMEYETRNFKVTTLEGEEVKQVCETFEDQPVIITVNGLQFGLIGHEPAITLGQWVEQNMSGTGFRYPDGLDENTVLLYTKLKPVPPSSGYIGHIVAAIPDLPPELKPVRDEVERSLCAFVEAYNFDFTLLNDGVHEIVETLPPEIRSELDNGRGA
jgi:hypothetical protein